MAVFVAICAGLVGWAVYTTFIEGRTSGPDFISAIQSGHVASDTIVSIEVVDPPVGHTPFTAGELASLTRLSKLDSPVAISRLLALLRDARPGWAPRNANHPVNSHHFYLKVNAKDGFFWLYCKIERDDNGPWFSFDANTLNATNPNGARSYNLVNFTDVLAIVEHGNIIEPNGAANGSQPIRAQTNSTPSAAGAGR